MPQSFQSPGAAATNSLFDFLREREARRRQDMLDEITKSTAARQDEVARGALEVQREQLTSLQEQRQAAAELSRQKRALGVIGMMQPGSAVDADTADVIRQGGFGSLISEAETSTQRATPVGPEDDPRSWIESTTSRTFAGTPQQALKRFIDDPNTTPEQRAFMEARLAAGDENLPYQLFQGPETQALFRVSSNRRGIERFENGAWVAHDGAIPKDAHWLTEPSAASGEASETRRIGMFNRIADGYERSPLVKAADRTIVLRNTADRILNDAGAASNASTQLNLAYSYIQALDTYQSAVREGELANLGALGTKLEVLGANIIRYLPREAGGQGQVMSPQVAREIATEAGTHSSSTMTLHHTVLHRALRKAVRDKLIASNPAVDLESKPRRSPSSRDDARQHAWTALEARAFLKAAVEAGPQPAAFYTLALDSDAEGRTLRPALGRG